MEKFTVLTSIAAYLPIMNIDTDMIIPKQFLKTIKRTGLGKNLFFEMRYDEKGSEKKDFLLNQSPFRQAKILIAGSNFGCGSSREHAPWALLDFGIRCVVASSFADIFYNNCFKNGILPIVVLEKQILELAKAAQSQKEITVDLKNQLIKSAGIEIAFEVEPFRKKCLLEGLDDIGLTLAKENLIKDFEEKQQKELPFLWE